MDIGKIRRCLFVFLLEKGHFAVYKFHTNQITFSANDLAEYFSVDRQTIYRMRASGRLPSGFLIGQRIRRWSLTELMNYSDELHVALTPFVQPEPKPANDNQLE